MYLPELLPGIDVHLLLPRKRYRLSPTISFSRRIAVIMICLLVEFQVHEIVVAFRQL